MTNKNDSQQGAETTTSPPSSNSDATDLNRSSSYSPKSNISNASVPSSKSTEAILLDQRLLGVNGTGQRQNLTITVSDPITSDASGSSKTLKPIQLGAATNSSDESINDDVDVEDKATEDLAKQNNITQFKEASTVLGVCVCGK